MTQPPQLFSRTTDVKHPLLRRARALILPLLIAPLAMAGTAAIPAGPPPAGAPPPGAPKSAPPSLIYQLPPGNYKYFDSGIGAAFLPPILSMPVEHKSALKPSANPRDLEGTWVNDQSLVYRILRDSYGFRLPYTPAARRILTARIKATYVNGLPFANASASCRPPGPHWQYTLNFPFQIYQGKRTIAFLFQEYHGLWVIRMNQAHHPEGERSYMGDSVGHWDGDTLVVDTTDFKIPTWIDVDGTPASKNAHIVFRISKVEEDGPELQITMTVHDPAMYTHPWSVVNSFAWRPQKGIFSEYNCEMQVGAPGGVARYGLIPEPPGE
jgi:hypothetical protein